MSNTCEENGHNYQQSGVDIKNKLYYVCSQCGQLLKFDLEKIEASELK